MVNKVLFEFRTRLDVSPHTDCVRSAGWDDKRFFILIAVACLNAGQNIIELALILRGLEIADMSTSQTIEQEIAVGNIYFSATQDEMALQTKLGTQ